VATDTAVINIHRSAVAEVGGFLERERLTPVEAADLARLAGRVRWMSNVEAQNSQEILRQGAQLKLAPSNQNPTLAAKIDDFCRSVAPSR
jgi:hypothetical protein